MQTNVRNNSNMTTDSNVLKMKTALEQALDNEEFVYTINLRSMSKQRKCQGLKL